MTFTQTAPRASSPAIKPAKTRPFTYIRFDLLRAFRNRRALLFSIGFPLLLFFLVAGPNKHEKLNGINFATYYMVGMLSWGAMTAMIGGGARITTERAVNWHRQLRVTPISARTYFSAKAITSYALASLSIATLYAAGASMGVHLSAVEWLELTGYVLVALVPFAVFGIVLGHVLTVDSIGPAVGGLASLFALLGGAWGPLATGGARRDRSSSSCRRTGSYGPATPWSAAGRGPRRRGWSLPRGPSSASESRFAFISGTPIGYDCRDA